MDSARRHFRKEALALAKLNHPNIASVYEFGSHQHTDFLVMEYGSGRGSGSLAAHFPKRKSVNSEYKLQQLSRRLTEAVSFIAI